jgi:hypothetical protein
MLRSLTSGRLGSCARRFALATALCLPVTACQTTVSGGTSAPRGATFCEIAEPLRWSVKDTRETQDQAVEHNAVGKELCGWPTK